MRPAAKPAQVPKGTFPTPLEPVKAPGRVSGEAASTDIPRGAHSAREQRHRLRASPAGPSHDAIPNLMKPSARPARASPTLETGPRFPRAGPLGLARRSTRKRQAHGLDSSDRTSDRLHTMRRGPVANPAEEGRRRNRMRPERRTRVRAPCPEPDIRVPVKGRGWRPVRYPRRQAGRHRARTGPEGHRAGPRDPNQAVVLHEEDRPPGSFDVLRGRSPPRRRPCVDFRRNPPRIRQQNPDRIGTGPPGERPAALRRTDRSPSRSFARERGGRLPGLRLPSARGGPEGLCRDSAKDACSDTFAYRLHGILLLLKRSRRMSVFARFSCA